MWVLAQANWKLRHFPESAVKLMVPALMRDILEHCGSQDEEVRDAGLYAAHNFLDVCAAQLQEIAARQILCLVKQNLPSPDSRWHTRSPFFRAMKCLSCACRALNSSQRQECVALLASYFQLFQLDGKAQLEVISELLVFWRADADPSKTYAATTEQLLQLERSVLVHPKARSELYQLLLT